VFLIVLTCIYSARGSNLSQKIQWRFCIPRYAFWWLSE